MREPSASYLALVQACAHPWTSGTPWPEDRSTTGDVGTRIHRAVEALETGEPVFPSLLAGLSESERRYLYGCRDAAEAYLRGHVWLGSDGRRCAEQRIRYHVESGRAVEREHGWLRQEGWWTAILDHVSWISPDMLRVIDWKTGLQRDAVPAARHPQLRMQAAAAAALHGVSRVRAELVYLDPGGYEVDAADFDALRLATVREELRDLRQSLLGGPTPPQPGPWCTTRHCPLRGVCPATAAALASAYPLERPLSVRIEDDAHARYVFERLPAAAAALDEIRHALAEYARGRLVDLGDGRVYGWREQSERHVRADTPEQRAALARVLGEDGMRAVQTRYVVTLGSIEDAAAAALRTRGETRGKAGLVRAVLAELERAGGVTTTRWEKAEAFKKAV